MEAAATAVSAAVAVAVVVAVATVAAAGVGMPKERPTRWCQGATRRPVDHPSARQPH
jgi:hypothetical protein